MRTGSLAAHSTATAQPWEFKSKPSTTDVREKALRKYVESKAGQREDTISAQMSTAQALMDRRRDLPAYANSDKLSVSRTSHNTLAAPIPLQDGFKSNKPANVYDPHHRSRVRKKSAFRKRTNFSAAHLQFMQVPPAPPAWPAGVIPPPPPQPRPDVVTTSDSDSSEGSSRKKPAGSPFFRWAAGYTARKGSINNIDSTYNRRQPRWEATSRPSIGTTREDSRSTAAPSDLATHRGGRLKRDYATFGTDQQTRQTRDTQADTQIGSQREASMPPMFMSPAMQSPTLPCSPIAEGILGQEIVSSAQIVNPVLDFETVGIDKHNDHAAIIASNIIPSSSYKFAREKLKYTISEDRTMDASKRNRKCFSALVQNSTKKNTRNRTFKCIHHDCVGDEGFLDKEDLTNHITVFHIKKLQKEYACKICGKTFTRAFHRSNHEKTHRGEQPQECSTCGKAFTRLNDLNRHKAIHERSRLKSKSPTPVNFRFAHYNPTAPAQPHLPQ